MNVLVNASRSIEIAVDNKTHIHHSWEVFFLPSKESERYGNGWERKRKREKWKKKRKRRKRHRLFIPFKRGDGQKIGFSKTVSPTRVLFFAGLSLSLFNLPHSLFFRVTDFSGNGNVLTINLSDKISISPLWLLPSLQFWAMWHPFCLCGWPKAIKKTLALFLCLYPFLSHSRCLSTQMGQLLNAPARIVFLLAKYSNFTVWRNSIRQ